MTNMALDEYNVDVMGIVLGKRLFFGTKCVGNLAIAIKIW